MCPVGSFYSFLLGCLPPRCCLRHCEVSSHPSRHLTPRKAIDLFLPLQPQLKLFSTLLFSSLLSTTRMHSSLLSNAGAIYVLKTYRFFPQRTSSLITPGESSFLNSTHARRAAYSDGPDTPEGTPRRSTAFEFRVSPVCWRLQRLDLGRIRAGRGTRTIQPSMTRSPPNMMMVQIVREQRLTPRATALSTYCWRPLLSSPTSSASVGVGRANSH